MIKESRENGDSSNEDASFKKRKTAFFADFARAHASSFRPHYQRGETLGRRGQEIWRNVSKHCLVSGVLTDVLADELRLPLDLKDKIVKAAILHDWFKKHEAEEMYAAGLEKALSIERLSEVREKDAQALREMKVPEDVIHLTGANIPETEDGPQTISEKIIWYVDMIVSNSEILSLQKTLANRQRGYFDEDDEEKLLRAERQEVFSNLFRDKYKGKTLDEVQQAIGNRIEPEFANLIGYDGKPEELPDFLRGKIIERIDQHNSS